MVRARAMRIVGVGGAWAGDCPGFDWHCRCMHMVSVQQLKLKLKLKQIAACLCLEILDHVCARGRRAPNRMDSLGGHGGTVMMSIDWV